MNQQENAGACENRFAARLTRMIAAGALVASMAPVVAYADGGSSAAEADSTSIEATPPLEGFAGAGDSVVAVAAAAADSVSAMAAGIADAGVSVAGIVAGDASADEAGSVDTSVAVAQAAGSASAVAATAVVDGDDAGISATATESTVAMIDENEYGTLAEAIAAAESGDEIVLQRSTTENITINVPITLNLDGNTLTGAGSGSVVTIRSDGVTVKDGTVTGGIATNGGAFNVSTEGSVVIENCTITGNSATNGGAIYLNKGSLSLIGGTIEDNVASNSGGAIHLTTDGSLTNVSCSIENGTRVINNAASLGGAVGLGASHYVTKGTTALLTVKSGEISNNKATSIQGGGGAIYAVGNGSRIVINGGVISGNSAAGNGGAVYSKNWHGATIEGGTISGNSAKGSGGAVYIENVNLGSNPLEKEVLSVGASAVVAGNSAGVNGGGIAASETSVVVNDGAVICNNTAKSIGDDIYAASGCELNLASVAQKQTLAEDGKDITGWYYDGYENSSTRYRWAKVKEEIVLEYDEAGMVVGYHKERALYYSVFSTSDPYTSVVGLKAAHGPSELVVTYAASGVVPAGYEVPESKSIVEGTDYVVADVPVTIKGECNGQSGTFYFDGWKHEGVIVEELAFVLKDVELTGVWSFVPDYAVAYEFVSGTEGMELPEDVTFLLPTDGEQHEVGAVVTAQQPVQAIVKVEGGTWTFEGYDANEKTVDGDLTFVGTWVYAADPVIPEDPDTPDEPVAPVVPDVPADPSTPADPDVPVAPDAPSAPQDQDAAVIRPQENSVVLAKTGDDTAGVAASAAVAVAAAGASLLALGSRARRRS